MAAEGALLGMGNPLLDISAHVDSEYLAKYELADKENLAILAEEKHLPIYHELVADYKVDYIAGGATQNSIRVAQWLLQKPQSTTFIGCVGKDKFGAQLRESAEKQHVKVAYLEDAEAPTGTCAVLVTGKHRTLVANIAAANHYKEAHLDQPEIATLVEKAKVFYISGFFLTVSPPTILRVAEGAALKNKIFCMNLAAPFISQFFTEPLMKTAPYWDFIFGNESEAEAFSEAAKFGTKDLKEIALKMAELPKENAARPRVVVITHGAEPTIIATNGSVKEYPVEQIAEDDIVDTNGAGDAFVGGFLSQLVLGKDIEECVRCGQWSARVILHHNGCTFPEKCDFA